MEENDSEGVLISKNTYLDAVRRGYPIYGDFLSLAAFNVSALPNHMSNSVLDISLFYREFEVLIKHMFWAYLDLALLKKGYMEVNEEEDVDVNDIRSTIIEQYLGLSGKSVGYEHDNPEFISDYMTIQDRKPVSTIMAMNDYPVVNDPDSLYYYTFTRENMEAIVEVLNGSDEDRSKNELNKIIVIEPLFQHLHRDKLRSFKRMLEERIIGVSILSVFEFIQMIGLDEDEFNDEWAQIRGEAIKNFENRYPFIKIRKDSWRIDSGKREIEKAWVELQKTQFTEDNMKSLMWQTSTGVEALLGVFYRAVRDKGPENLSLGDMLSQTRNDVETEFGKDVYNDLWFIREMRNKVDHPKDEIITKEDTIKVVSKAKMFHTLFLSKMGLNNP